MNMAITTRARGLVVLLTLGLLASVAAAAETPLTNGVPVTELSGAAGSQTYYRIDVPAGQDELVILTTGGTGDVDLYVRLGALPTTTSYDYRPYKVGNEETVTVPTPAAGTWYIMLRGYAIYAGVTLRATYTAAVTITPLTNGVPVPGLTGAASSEKYFSIVVPAGQTKLEIAISGGTGDADLYVKKGVMPTTSSYDYRPFLFGNNESVTVNSPAADTWYIMIRGYDAYSGVTLLASYAGGVGTLLENGVAVPNLSGTASSEKVYRIEVPAGQINLEIKIWGGTGDADLYVKFGAKPTTTDYDYRPYLAGNDETVAVNNPAAGTWYIVIRSYAAYTGLSLQATYSDVFTLQDGVAVPALAGAAGSEKFYKIEVPSGQSEIVFSISGGTGNADMYIRRGAKPTTATWDYRPYLAGNNESVTVSSPQAGTWYVMLKGRDAYSGVALKADYTFTGTVVLLANGVPVTGISGSAGSEKFYRLIVPGGQASLEFKISGGTGDADLYVKKGSLPTTADYDYRPYQIGNDETVTVNDPAGADWFVMIRGYQAYSGLTLLATFGGATPPPHDDVTPLTNGVPVPGISGPGGSEKFYKIDVPAGQAKLEIMTSGGTGDVDLYVRKGSKPTTTEYDYRPYLVGNNETVSIDNPTAGTYFIMLKSYAAYDGVTLQATYTPAPEPVVTLTSGVPVTGLSGAAGSEKYFKIDVPAGQNFLNVQISGGTGDADLYVRKGAKPTTAEYDYRPYLVGNDEKVEITNPAAATWYMMVRGHVSYANVTIVATFGTVVGNNFATDPNCVALWRFEPDHLTMDSRGVNPLTNNGAQSETLDVREGAGCANFKAGETDWMSIDDHDLSPNFPTKNGDTNFEMSVCFWMKPRTFPFGGTMISKYLLSTEDRSWRLFTEGSGSADLCVSLGTGTGGSFKKYAFDDPNQLLTAGHWYHVAFTYRDVDRTYHVRVWDATAGVLRVDETGTATAHMAVTEAPLVLGSVPLMFDYSFDGLLDEVVVFNDVVTTEEIDQIRLGTYAKP
jgi:hypothetical protein